jgi:uncharacterized protein YkwD
VSIILCTQVNGPIRQQANVPLQSGAMARRPLLPARRARRLIGIVLIAAMLTSLAATPAAASTYRARLLDLINTSRVAKDLKPVKLKARLSKVATAHTKRMIDNDELMNVPNLKGVLKPYRWRVGGAVVGCGPSLAAIHRAFMAEPTHRDIILLRDVRRVGIGVVRSKGKTSCGKNAFWVTEIFYG